MTWLLALVAGAWSAPVLAQAPPAAPPDAATPTALETNPAVLAALELPRKEPADFVKVISWLIDLGRPELAKPILEELAKLQITDAQRAALVVQFGERTMLQIARTKELAPAGAEFANACMAAASTTTNDPKRITTLVAQLADPSPEARTIARNDLAAAGLPGVTAALEALARESHPDRRAALADGVAHMEPLVSRPLLAMLDTNDPALRDSVAAVLEQLKVPQAVPFLPASYDSAERQLSKAIDNIKKGTLPFEPNELDRIELWKWDDVTKKLSVAAYPIEEAKIIWMARLARMLTQLRPDSRTYQRQALILELEAAALSAAPRKSQAADLVATLDTQMLNELLADALPPSFAHAAVAAADELGKRRDASVLYVTNPQPSPLANALQHSNRRVRFAALRAIMALDPTSPYAGSSRVPEALTWFAGSDGERRAVVAMPTNAAASNLAGMLGAEGLHAVAVNSGRQAVDAAVQMADLEMIFVDMNIIEPDARQVLYELRISPTTGHIPIALMATEEKLLAAEKLAEEHRRVLAVSRPHSDEVLKRIVAQLSELAGREAAPADERVAQAKEAQAWLAGLSSGRRPFYNIRRTAPLEDNKP